MKVLVTGGAGFIGRWLVKRLLEEHQVWVLDNLDNSTEDNLKEFKSDPNYMGFSIGDIRDKEIVSELFKNKFDVCFHLAAQINVQESIDNPDKAYSVNVDGTYNILTESLKRKTKVVMMGTCMVYDTSGSDAIGEKHRIKPASPYAGSKVAAEALAESFYYAYGHPVVIVRPFNTYGPFQKTNMEGGVVAIFIKRKLEGKELKVFGDGTQTRDLLYVEDCADFLVKAGFNDEVVGQVVNAGTGEDITVNDLAKLISEGKVDVVHVEHHHPQAEIPKLLCDSSKAKSILGWTPGHTLAEGIKKTERWIEENEVIGSDPGAQ